MIGQIFNIIGPIATIVFIGYLIGRSSVGLHSRTLSTLVILVATPALIFHTLISMHVGADDFGTMALAAVLCVIIAGILGFLGLMAFRGSQRTFLPSLMMPNSGNMGLPLVVLAFGDHGMQLGVSYFFVIALAQYSIGLSISAGCLQLKQMARQPLVYSVALVLLVTFFDIPVPQMVMSTTEILGGLMIPAMLILLGSSLASLTVSDMRPALAVAIGRLVIGLISSLVVIYFMGLTGVEAGSVFLLASMPTAIVTFVFAERYRDDSAQVAGAVVVSTLLTLALLPVLIWIALWMAANGL